MYKLIFHQYYNFSAFCKDSFPGSFIRHLEYDALMLLSGMEYFNVLTIIKWAKIPIITTTLNLDHLITGIIIVGTNYLIFIYKKRHTKIIEECNQKNWFVKSLSSVFVIFYTFSSFYLLISVSS